MQYCQECGAVLDNKRRCPECGKRYPKKNTPLSIVVMILSILFFIGVCIYVFGGGFGGPDPGLITLSEFNAIENGMTYEQVVNIVGSEGDVLSSVDLGIGAEYASAMYTWEGDGSTGANANVTFQGGKVISKAQFGLK